MTSLYYPDWETLDIRDLPVPAAGENEVLLKVAACGICGSELESFKHRSPRRPPPLVMGHEFCGTVVDNRSHDDAFAVGRKVISNSIISCGLCTTCKSGNAHLCEQRKVFGMHRPGAFAAYVAVPASTLIQWPDELAAESACLSEPLANGIHVAHSLAHRKPELVLVIGAGPIGLMCQQALQVLIGSKTIVSDISPLRLEVAKQLGAHAIANPLYNEVDEIISKLTNGRGVDAVVDAVGSRTTKEQSLRLVRAGGAVVWIGLQENTIPIDTYSVTLLEKTIYGSYAATNEELRQAAAMMAAGTVDVSSWVQTYPLQDGVAAFERMVHAKGSDIKAVLVP
ncbi:MAG: alcohol dehydrogenase catalytic domain-containing protein [bacterium]